MSRIRFNYVFFFLMALAALGAFVLPPRFTDRVSPQLQILFAPVARPVRAVAAWAHGRDEPNLPADNRPAHVIRLEKEQLASENVWLRDQLERAQQKLAERHRLGPISELCTPVAVVGNDPGVRESLAVQGSSLEGLHDGMYVLHPGNTGVQIVGRLQRSGVLGGQVQLITNPGFRVTAYFVRAADRKPDAKDAKDKADRRDGRLNRTPALVEGAGRGHMVVRQLKLADVKAMGLQEGDRVVLDDEEWPVRLRGLQIGTVADIGPRPDHALFAEIRITPTSDLLKLREVMVMTKQ